MKTKIFLATILLPLAIFTGGCALFVVGAAAGAGAGTVMWVRGEIKSTEAVPFVRASRAAEAGLKDMGYAIVGKTDDAATSKTTARTPADQKVVVTVIKMSSEVSEIHVRVGTWGDEALSRQILEKIKSRF